MNAGFNKRVSSPRIFFRDLSFILTRIPRYLEVAWAKRVSLAFSEKIRLATTAVNQCVICARVHYEWAQLAGVDRNEIRALLNNDLNGGAIADDSELVALLYAQHYAESNQNPDPDKTRQLHDYYGPATATDILLIIRLISFFNLTGNTLEAFLSRIAGRKPRQSNMLFEILIVLLGVPIAIPVLVYTTIKKNRFDFEPAPTKPIQLAGPAFGDQPRGRPHV